MASGRPRALPAKRRRGRVRHAPDCHGRPHGPQRLGRSRRRQGPRDPRPVGDRPEDRERAAKSAACATSPSFPTTAAPGRSGTRTRPPANSPGRSSPSRLRSARRSSPRSPNWPRTTRCEGCRTKQAGCRAWGTTPGCSRSSRRKPTLARALGDQDTLGRSLIQRGSMLMRMGRYPDASAAFTTAREVFTAAGNDEEVAACDANLGNMAYMQGRFADAAERYERAYAVFERLNDDARMASTLHGMGNANYMQSDFSRALRYLHPCRRDLPAEQGQERRSQRAPGHGPRPQGTGGLRCRRRRLAPDPRAHRSGRRPCRHREGRTPASARSTACKATSPARSSTN